MNVTDRYQLFGGLIGASIGLPCEIAVIFWTSANPPDSPITVILAVLGVSAGVGLTLTGQWIGGNVGIRKEFPEPRKNAS